MDLNRANILITGPLGYVGGSLIPFLRRSFPNAHLTGIDSGWFVGCRTSCGEMPEDLLDRLWFKDVRSLVSEDFSEVDAVVHLAAVSNDPMGHTFSAATHSINYEATIILARLARRAGVRRFVFASSCSVYGAGPDEAVFEDGQLNPLTAYAKSKVDSEIALKKLATPDFLVTCLRFGTACGFSPRTRLDLVVNDFVASAIVNGQIQLLSTGNAWRPFIHIEDMARAMEWALQRCGLPFETVNVGSDVMTTRISALAEHVANIVLGAKVVIADDAGADARTYRVSFDRFKKLAPNYQPRWTIPATVQQLYEGFLSINFNDASFRQGPFIRLNQLQKMLADQVIDTQLHRVGTGPE